MFFDWVIAGIVASYILCETFGLFPTWDEKLEKLQ
jgi:hypothetical protein